ncbi:hypothetical protein D3C84_279160 [compost metagenome]
MLSCNVPEKERSRISRRRSEGQPDRAARERSSRRSVSVLCSSPRYRPSYARATRSWCAASQACWDNLKGTRCFSAQCCRSEGCACSTSACATLVESDDSCPLSKLTRGSSARSRRSYNLSNKRLLLPRACSARRSRKALVRAVLSPENHCPSISRRACSSRNPTTRAGSAPASRSCQVICKVSVGNASA